MMFMIWNEENFKEHLVIKFSSHFGSSEVDENKWKPVFVEGTKERKSIWGFSWQCIRKSDTYAQIMSWDFLEILRESKKNLIRKCHVKDFLVEQKLSIVRKNPWLNLMEDISVCLKDSFELALSSFEVFFVSL